MGGCGQTVGLSSRSSVLFVVAEQLGALWVAMLGRYAEGAEEFGEKRVEGIFLLATDLLVSVSTSRVMTYAWCNDFPTSGPMAIFGLLGGAIAAFPNRQITWRCSVEGS